MDYAFRRNLVLAASAGTGKTHALVGIITHLLLGATELGAASDQRRLHPPLDPGRLVATTFSKKAAAEIRARVTAELERLVLAPRTSAYAESIERVCRAGGGEGWSEVETVRRARRALEGIDRAFIGTFHSYAATLCQRYALEIGLAPDFAVVEEDEAARRRDDVIAEVLEKHAHEEAILDFVELAGSVERLVMQISRTLTRLEEYGIAASELVLPEDDALRVRAQRDRVIQAAARLVVDGRYRTLADAVVRAAPAGTAELEEAVSEILTARMSVRGAPTSEAEAAVLDFVEVRESLPGTTHLDRVRRLLRSWRCSDRFLASSRRARDLLAECELALAENASANSTLGFGDVLRVARDLLLSRPDLAVELSNDVQALLIDEFQDTSRLQRELVHLVWARPETRVAGIVPHVADLRRSGLLVVGDRKQSIYGFRGADVGVFAEFCIGLAGAQARHALGVPAGRAWEPQSPSADIFALRHNRRGNPELLEFANAFSAVSFGADRGDALFEVAYTPETEDLVSPPERAGAANRCPRTFWLRVPTPRSSSSRLDDAFAIAERIATIVKSGETTLLDRPAGWRDMAILAQTNDMLDAASFALARWGIPYVVAGKGFFATREVRDLAAMLALVSDPGDRLALATVLRGPWAGMRDVSLLGLTDPGRGLREPVLDWMDGERRPLVAEDERVSISRVFDVVLRLSKMADRIGPASVLREAMRELAFEAVLERLPRGRQRVANVRKLVRLAERERSIRGFLRKLDRSLRSASSESEAATFSEEDDAVRLLTVHASKGLDFPIVFLPQAGATAPASERSVFAVVPGEGDRRPQLSTRVPTEDGPCDPPSYLDAVLDADRRLRAERRRLAYVAVTRSSEALFLVGDRAPPRSGDGVTYRTTIASTLAQLEAQGGALREVFSTIETVPDPEKVVSLHAPVPSSSAESPTSDASGSLELPPWTAVTLAPTSLQTFAHCPRRYQLLHVLGLREDGVRRAPGDNGEKPAVIDQGSPGRDGPLSRDPRAEGTLMHRVLERIPEEAFGSSRAQGWVEEALGREGLAADDEVRTELMNLLVRFLSGSYAKRVGREGAKVLRETPFVLRLGDAAGRFVSLRGTIDLIVVWPKGDVDVIDYKTTRTPRLEPYALQLDAYVLAVETMLWPRQTIRSGIVFLEGQSGDPTWRKEAPLPLELRARLTQLAGQLVEARGNQVYPRVHLGVCQSIRCGFVPWCHAREGRDREEFTG